MRNAGSGGKVRDVEGASVGGLDGLFVWHTNVDAIVGWLSVEARAVDGKEVASAGCVGECSRGWGTVTIGVNWLVTRINRASAIAGGCNCPELSVLHNAVFVFLRAAHRVGASGTTLVTVSREATSVAVMAGIDVIAVGPTIVHVREPFGPRGVGVGGGRGVVGRWVARGAIVVATVVGSVVGAVVEAGLILLDLLAKLHEFGILHSDLLEKGFVGGLQAAEEITVGGCCHGEVGKGIGGFVGEVFHGVVGMLVAGSCSGGTQVGEVGVGDSELRFEVLPRLVGGGGAAPFAARFVELLCAKHNRVGVVDDLASRVGVATGIGIVLGIFDLLDERFKRFGGIVGCLEALVVGVKVHWGDPSVGAIQMGKYLNRCHVGVCGVFILEHADVDIRDSRKKELFQCIVDSVVVAEEAQGGRMLANVGRDLGVGAIGKCRGSGPGVGGNDEWCAGSQGGVDGGGDSESEVAELATTVFGVDGRGVGFQEGSDLVDSFVGGRSNDGWNRWIREGSDDAVDSLG